MEQPRLVKEIPFVSACESHLVFLFCNPRDIDRGSAHSFNRQDRDFWKSFIAVFLLVK